MVRIKSFVVTYWPIIAILPIAYGICLVVDYVGEPWTAGDWGSNVVLAILITVATVMLTRKQAQLQVKQAQLQEKQAQLQEEQAQLQENSADLELDEKIAVLSGSINELERERTAGRTCQVINDVKAGLNLIGAGHPEARDEYLDVLTVALRKIEEMMTRDLLLYTLWTSREWRTVADAVGGMLKPLERRPDRARNLDKERLITVQALVNRIESIASSDFVPLDVFRRQYEGNDIRVQLDWNVLEESLISIERFAWVGTADLGRRRIYAPWYKNSAGDDCSPEAVGAEAVRLDQFESWMGRMNPRRKRTIDEIVSDMNHARSDRPYRFEFVTLQVWGERFIVLDGNHRLAAAFLRDSVRDVPGRNVEIIEYRLHAEPSVGLLRDLGWHIRTRHDGLATA